MNPSITRVANRYAAKKTAGEFNLHETATFVARHGINTTNAKLQGLVDKAGAMMAKHGWVLDSRASGIDINKRLGDDGKYIEGSLVFKDTNGDKYYTDAEVKELFESVLDVDGDYYRHNNEFIITFDS